MKESDHKYLSKRNLKCGMQHTNCREISSMISETAEMPPAVGTCVMCGEVIPEGWQHCPSCFAKVFDDVL